jgi:predicted TIM-barrel fold metal-dependent hydrolase
MSANSAKESEQQDALSGTFETIYAGFRAAVADLSEPDRRKLFHDNAVRRL